MSFDIYLQCHEDGELAAIPRQTVRSKFPIVDGESEPDYWKIRYDALHYCSMSVSSLPSNPEMLDSISFNRPCGGIPFFRAVLDVMRLGNVVLYYPGCPGPLVAAESVGPHLPPDMIASLGQPICVRSAEELAGFFPYGGAAESIE